MSAPAPVSSIPTLFPSEEASHAVSLPSSLAAGDKVIIVQSLDKSSPASAPVAPSGWTQITVQSVFNTEFSFYQYLSIYYREIDGTEASTVTFTPPEATKAAYLAMRLPPYADVSRATWGGQKSSPTFSKNPNADSVTSTEQDCCVYSIFTAASNALSGGSTPSGWTLVDRRVSGYASGEESFGVAYKTLPAAGVSGASSWGTTTFGTVWICGHLIVPPVTTGYIRRRGSSFVCQTTAGTSVVIPQISPSPQSGDLILLIVQRDNTSTGGNSINTPSGFALLADYGYTSQMASRVFYKVASASEPSSYTVTWTLSEDVVAGIVVFYNVDSVSPVSAYATGNGLSNRADAPAITPADAFSMAVAIAGSDLASEQSRGPDKYGLLYSNNSGGTSLQVATLVLYPAVATGVASFTLDSVEEWGAIHLALKPLALTNRDIVLGTRGKENIQGRQIAVKTSEVVLLGTHGAEALIGRQLTVEASLHTPQTIYLAPARESMDGRSLGVEATPVAPGISARADPFAPDLRVRFVARKPDDERARDKRLLVFMNERLRTIREIEEVRASYAAFIDAESEEEALIELLL